MCSTLNNNTFTQETSVNITTDFNIQLIISKSDLNFLTTCMTIIISLRERLKTSLIPPLFIELHVQSQENERPMRPCVLVLSNLPVSAIFLLHFRTFPTVCAIFCFSFYVKYTMLLLSLLLLDKPRWI